MLEINLYQQWLSWRVNHLLNNQKKTTNLTTDWMMGAGHEMWYCCVCLPYCLETSLIDGLGNSIAKCGASVRVCDCLRMCARTMSCDINCNAQKYNSTSWIEGLLYTQKLSSKIYCGDWSNRGQAIQCYPATGREPSRWNTAKLICHLWLTSIRISCYPPTTFMADLSYSGPPLQWTIASVWLSSTSLVVPWVSWRSSYW